MRAAVALRNVVGKAQHRFVIAVVPLHGEFHRDAVFFFFWEQTAALPPLLACDRGTPHKPQARHQTSDQKPWARPRAYRSAPDARRNSKTRARAAGAPAWKNQILFS